MSAALALYTEHRIPNAYLISLSIIIPTYKRAEILRHCLEHLAGQTCAKEMEVIVVSDGHDEKTTQLFDKNQESRTRPDDLVGRVKNQEHYKNNWPFPVRFFEIAKSHQGVARNEGVKQARGEIVLFIGDDILLAPDVCERHLKAHKSHKQLTAGRGPLIAVLGYTTWDPGTEVTPVMCWLERSGWQFQYPSIACYGHGLIPVSVQHRYTYTSHVSVPLAIARAHPFRTDIRLYGWEDVEWGMRLKKAGVRLYYEPHARALHRHRITLEESLKRMEVLGESVYKLEKLVPGFDRRPRGLKLLLYRIAALLPTMAGRHRKAFLRGLDRGQLKANN